MAEPRARRGAPLRVFAAALACSALVHALALFGLRFPAGPVHRPGSAPIPVVRPRPLAMVELPSERSAAFTPAAEPPRPEAAPSPVSHAEPAPPIGPAAEEADAEAASVAAALRPGYRDPRLYVRPGEAARRELDPYQRMEESLEERVAALHDSARAERRRKADASIVRVFGVAVPLFGSADGYRDPEWDAIRAQEEARRRAETLDERVRAARERRRGKGR